MRWRKGVNEHEGQKMEGKGTIKERKVRRNKGRRKAPIEEKRNGARELRKKEKEKRVRES
jgi:hypothetical protein